MTVAQLSSIGMVAEEIDGKPGIHRSEVVRLIHDRQGKQEAIAFASHITKLAGATCSREMEKVGQHKGLDLEIGD